MKATVLDKNNVVSRSNRLLHMRYNPFNLGTLKILDTFLSRINPLDETVRTVSFTKKEYEALIGVRKINISNLRTYTDQLQDCKVVLPIEGGGYDSITLFERCRVYKEKGENIVELTCSSSAKNVFFNLEGVRYIKYQLSNVLQMSSIYSMFLYYYIVENEFRTHWIISAVELRKVLHVESRKYTEMKDFKRYVLKPAVNEINHLTNYTISCDSMRNGKYISDFEFYIVNVETTPLMRNYYNKREEIVDEAYRLYTEKCSMLPKPSEDNRTKSMIVRAYNNGVDFNTLFGSISFFVSNLPIPYSYWEVMKLEWILKNATRIYGLLCDNMTEKDTEKTKREITALLAKEVRRIEQKAKRDEQMQ